MKSVFLGLVFLFTAPCFAADVAFVFYCPKMNLDAGPYEKRRQPTDTTAEQALGVLASRWAPFSPLRAKRVYDRSLQLLNNVSWVNELPPPTEPKPTWVKPECTQYSTATLDEHGRMLAIKEIWDFITPAERAFVTFELALTQEVPALTEKAIGGIRLITFLLFTNQMTETYLDMAGSQISESFSRELPYESGEFVLIPPSLSAQGSGLTRRICGYSIAGLAPATECTATSLYVNSFDRSRVLRISPFRSGMGEQDPVYLYSPEKLGLPAGVTDYYFSTWDSERVTERKGVLLKFDRDVTFETARVRLHCRAKTPVAFTISAAEMEKRDFHNLRFYGCPSIAQSELLMNGTYVELPVQFKKLSRDAALHVFTKERAMSVTAPRELTWGSFKFTISKDDTVQVADLSKSDSFNDDNALKISFSPATQQEVSGDAFDCKPRVTSVEETNGIQTITLSAKNKCRLKGLQTQVSVQDFQIDPVTRKVVGATAAWLRDKKTETKISEVRFRPTGELWSFQPAPESKGLKYYDTQSQAWTTKEADFPFIDRLCYNPALKRFEDGRSTNPACPPAK